jgi:hypothetical protein
MNLLLYAEARQSIARLRGESFNADIPQIWYGSQTPSLPDSLFAELGYCGALAVPGGQSLDPTHEHESLRDLLERELSVV